MKIPFFVQEFTEEMENSALEALRNESFVGGESVLKFEEEFAKYTGTKYAVSVNSGNSALQISLMSLPSYPSVTDEQVEIIAESVNKIIN